MRKLKFSMVMVLALSLVLVVLSGGCAEGKTFDHTNHVETYGLLSPDLKDDCAIYEANTGNVVLSVIFFETVFIPIWLVGWELYEPVSYKVDCP